MHGLIDKSTDIRPLRYNDKCDKWNYLTAVGTGVIAGIIDIFLVGSPTDSVLQPWTDKQIDKSVMSFAKSLGWNKDGNKTANINSAIAFLEMKFPVNYDQAHTAAVGGAFKMNTKNHHMMSLAHSPDIVGLFFSVLAQFSSKSFFVAGGNLVAIDAETQMLIGGNLPAKLFCGVANWFGHLMSDIAGSSVAVGRGSGIVKPFYELLGFMNFGKFQIEKDRQNLATLATLATRAFQEGYDARFALTMSIPVLLSDLLTRLIWSIRHYFQYKKPLSECIPTSRHDDLQVSLIVSNGVLCLMDGADALIQSGGNALLFFTRLNLIAWIRLTVLVVKEVMLRCGIEGLLKSWRRVNEYLTEYMERLKKLDEETYKTETENYNKMIPLIEKANSQESLNMALNYAYECCGIEKPWKGNFDEFMGDRNNKLVFS